MFVQLGQPGGIEMLDNRCRFEQLLQHLLALVLDPNPVCDGKAVNALHVDPPHSGVVVLVTALTEIPH